MWRSEGRAFWVEGTARVRTLRQVSLGCRGTGGRDCGRSHMDEGREVSKDAGTRWPGPVGTERSWDFILSAMSVQSRGMWLDGAFAVTELVGLNAKGKRRALCSQIEDFKRGDFPASPVVRTLRFHCRGHGFNPWLGN